MTRITRRGIFPRLARFNPECDRVARLPRGISRLVRRWRDIDLTPQHKARSGKENKRLSPTRTDRPMPEYHLGRAGIVVEGCAFDPRPAKGMTALTGADAILRWIEPRPGGPAVRRGTAAGDRTRLRSSRGGRPGNAAHLRQRHRVRYGYSPRLRARGGPFTFVGRAPHYGLAAFGERGVAHVLDILRASLEADMGQMGISRPGDAR